MNSHVGCDQGGVDEPSQEIPREPSLKSVQVVSKEREVSRNASYFPCIVNAYEESSAITVHKPANSSNDFRLDLGIFGARSCVDAKCFFELQRMRLTAADGRQEPSLGTYRSETLSHFCDALS